MDEKKLLNVTFKRLEFEPTEPQWDVLVCLERLVLMGGGIRGGKSEVGAKKIMGRWNRNWHPGDRPLLYWIAGKDYETTLPEFEYCVEAAIKLGIDIDIPKRVYADALQLILGIGGDVMCIIKNKSLKDELKIGMEAPDGIVLCEAAQATFSAFQKLRARLSEKAGWLLCTGTFEKEVQGWYPDYYRMLQAFNEEDGKSFSVPSWTNTNAFKGGRGDPEILKAERELPPDMFMEMFGGIPSKPSDLVIPDFAYHVHVGQYNLDTKLPVILATDPGYAPSAASVLAIQEHGDDVWVIGEVYVHRRITEEVIDICSLQPWWPFRGTSGVMDVASRAHPAMASPEEVWRNRGGVVMRSRKVNLEGGIDLLRTYLKVHPLTGEPKIKINYKCLGLICEFGGGKPFDLGMSTTHNEPHFWGPWQRDRLTGKPSKDHCHSAKTLAYYLANLRGYDDDVRGKRRAAKRY